MSCNQYGVVLMRYKHWADNECLCNYCKPDNDRDVCIMTGERCTMDNCYAGYYRFIQWIDGRSFID